METVKEKDTTYNGWTNYETWAVALWIDNEEWSYRESRRIVKHAADHAIHADTPAFAVANALEAWQREMADTVLDEPGMASSVWADLLGAALSKVSWYEIAENYLSELDES